MPRRCPPLAELLFVVRLIHVAAGVAWLGEVVTVNFVLIPALRATAQRDRVLILERVFPGVFRLATVLGAFTIAAGATLFLLTTGGDVSRLWTTAWGVRILIGGILGGAVFAFHLLQESRLEGTLAHQLEDIDLAPERAEVLLARMQVIPRVGLGILVLCILFMSAAARLP